ncbi:chain-length determining protein [Myxococcaceae bacterium GXIMD 01537]
MEVPPVEPRPEPTHSSADLFDWKLLADLLGFVLNALRRHRFLAMFVLALFVGLAVVATKVMPRSYYVEAKILTERNLIIASLVNPSRTVPRDDDAPTRTAFAQILRRDNLISVVKKAKLVERWDATRAPLQRLKDALTSTLSPPVSEADRLDMLVDMLERAMAVQANRNTGTVTIAVGWPEPQQTQDIAETAQQNFLEARHAAEVTAINEAIGILDSQVREEEDGIRKAIAELEDAVRIADARHRNEEKEDPGKATRRAQRLLRTDHTLAQMRFMLEAKRKSISDMEAYRDKRLNELRALLAEQRTIYSAMHPALEETQQRIEALKGDSPELLAMRHEETSLAEEFVQRGGADVQTLLPSALSYLYDDPLAGSLLGTPDDPEVAVATDRLRMVVARHQDMIRRLSSARMELEIARASFKHRYSVLSPPSFPKRPVKPNTKLILVGGVVAGLGLAVFTAVALDVWRRRLLERWQVERLLKLRVVAQLERP